MSFTSCLFLLFCRFSLYPPPPPQCSPVAWYPIMHCISLPLSSRLCSCLNSQILNFIIIFIISRLLKFDFQQHFELQVKTMLAARSLLAKLIASFSLNWICNKSKNQILNHILVIKWARMYDFLLLFRERAAFCSRSHIVYWGTCLLFGRESPVSLGGWTDGRTDGTDSS